MAAAVSVNVRDFTHRITLKVKGVRSWSIRLRIAAVFFKAGAWIAGVGLVFESAPLVDTTKPGDEWRTVSLATD